VHVQPQVDAFGVVEVGRHTDISHTVSPSCNSPRHTEQVVAASSPLPGKLCFTDWLYMNAGRLAADVVLAA
jgi:hypothetical protein